MMLPAQRLLLPMMAALGAVVSEADRFAIAASPDAAQHVSRGIHKHQAGDFAAAAREFSRAAQFAPDDPRVLFDEACALAALEKWDDAEDLFRKATLATDEKLAAASWYNLGWIAAQRGKVSLGNPPAATSGEPRAAGLQHLQRAIDYYRSALQLDPTHAEARHNLELLKLLHQQLKETPQQPQPQPHPAQEPQQQQQPPQEERPPPESDKSQKPSDPRERSKSSPADAQPDTAKQPDPQDAQQPSDSQQPPQRKSPSQQSESQQSESQQSESQQSESQQSESQQSESQQSAEMQQQSRQEKEGTNSSKSGPQEPAGKPGPSSATADASQATAAGNRDLSPEEQEAAAARQAAEMVLQRVREREREYRQLQKQRTRARSATVDKDW